MTERKKKPRQIVTCSFRNQSFKKNISLKWERLQQLLFGKQALCLNLLIMKHRRFEINFFMNILNVEKCLFFCCLRNVKASYIQCWRRFYIWKQTENTFFNIQYLYHSTVWLSSFYFDWLGQFFKKLPNWAKLSSLIMREQEETRTRYFAP